MIIQILNKSSRIPYVYDASENVTYNYTSNDISDFKVINIDEDSFGNVFLMCRKDDYKFRIIVNNFNNYFFVEDVKGEYKTFDDKFNVRKAFFKNNKDKKEIIDNLSFETRTFETDIKNSYRFSINYIKNFQIEEDVKKFKVLYFDIETESSVDVINTPAPIISISFINSFDNKSIFLTWHKNVKEDTVFEKEGKQYRYYTNEVSMLKFFIEEFQRCDIVTGWNIKGFDIIYLYSRLKHLSLNGDVISPVGRVYNGIKKDDDRFAGNKFRVYGIDIMDMKEMLADVIKFSLDKPTNMTLDVVAKFFLKDFTKLKLEKSISETWRDGDLEKLGSYNIRDVEILTQLNAKMNLFFYYSNIRNILKCMNLSDTQHNSITIDKMILTKYHDKVFPSKRYAEKIDFEGAFVKEPVEGIYNYVGIFDFNALYPNLIRTFNISPDTLVDEMNENCAVINGCYFDLSKKGILSELVDELIKTRYEYKKLKNSFVKGDDKYTVYESMETAFKAIVNSIYGVFGLNSFRLYDSRIASSITGSGRMVIKDVMNYINQNKDFKVIGGDSVSEDTCIFLLNNKSFDNFEILRMVDLWKRYDKKKYFKKNKEYIDLENCFTITYDYNKKENVIEKINKIIRHKTNKKLYTIKNNDTIVKVTEDHSLMLNGKQTKPTIFLDKHKNNIKIDSLKDYKLKIKNIKKIDLKDIYVKYAEIFNSARKNIVNKFEHKITKDKFICKVVNYKNKVVEVIEFPRFIKIDDNFSNLIGAYISEGSVCYSKTTKCFTNLRVVTSKNNKKWNNIIYNSAIQIFGKNLITKVEYDKMYFVKGNHFLLACIFGELFGYKSENKKLDKFVFDTNKKFIKNIFDNYQIGDGYSKWIDDDKRYNVGGKSRLFVSQSYFLFKHFLFKTPYFSIKYYKEKDCCGFAVRDYKPLQHNLQTLDRIYIDNTEKYVYDLEVENNHYFVDVFGDVLLHNTDSVFVSCAKSLEYQEIKKIFIGLEDELNNNAKEYLKSVIPRKHYDDSNILLRLECETIFKKLILPNAKKKYVGLVKLFKGKELDKEIVYGRNIELIKRDTPDAIKKILKKLMDYLLNIDDMIDLKIKILELKSEIYNLEYKDLLISKQINKNFNEYKVRPQHIKAMLFSNENLGTTFSRDNYKGGMIYVKSSKYPDTKVIMLDDTTEFPKEFEINYDKYFDLFVKRKIILLNSQFEVLFSENNTLTKWL